MEPKKLPPSINSDQYQSHAFIAPEESYLLFSSYERKAGFGKADLYISFNKDDGTWTPSKNMGKNCMKV